MSITIPTPTLNLPQPAVSSSGTSKAAGATPATAPLPPASPAAAGKTPDAPSATVTLSPQAMSALASAASHPTSTSSAEPSPAPATAPHSSSVYESLKSGISTAVTDVGDAVADGAHAVVEGVETTLSTANKVATGILEFPFAAVSKGCDAVGALIDKL